MLEIRRLAGLKKSKSLQGYFSIFTRLNTRADENIFRTVSNVEVTTKTIHRALSEINLSSRHPLKTVLFISAHKCKSHPVFNTSVNYCCVWDQFFFNNTSNSASDYTFGISLRSLSSTLNSRFLNSQQLFSLKAPLNASKAETYLYSYIF